MAKIEKAKNHEGKTIFPVTVADAVLMGNGKTLKRELSELGSEVRPIFNEVFGDISVAATLENAVAVKVGGILSSGARDGSSNYNNYYFKNDGYAFVSAFVGGIKGTTNAAIAFYNNEGMLNDDELYESSCIGLVPFNGIQEQINYKSNVPKGCKMIVVSCRKDLFPEHHAELYKSEGRLLSEIDRIDNDIKSVNSDIVLANKGIGNNSNKIDGLNISINGKYIVSATLENAVAVKVGGILSSGARDGSSNYNNYYFKNDGYAFVSAFVGGIKGTTNAAIAFYNNEGMLNENELYESSCIGVVQYNGVQEQIEYSSKVPKGCKVIVVSCRKDIFPEHSAELYKLETIGLEEKVKVLENEISSLKDSQVKVDKDWKCSLWWTPNATWNEKTGTCSFNKSRITSLSYLHVLSDTTLVVNSGAMVKAYRYDEDGNYISVKVYDTNATLVQGSKYLFTAYNIELDNNGIEAPFLYATDNPVWSMFSIIGNEGAEYTEIDIKNDIPSYYIDEISSVVSSAISELRNTGNNKSAFIFTTDSHWGSNEKHSIPIINEIIRDTKISMVIEGGDIITDKFSEKSLAYAELDDFVARREGFKRSFIAIGNHDSNSSAQTNLSAILTKENVYSSLYIGREYEISDWGDYFAYYINNVAEKTRYVVLSTGLMTVSAKEWDWFVNSALAVEEEWNIVVITHVWKNANEVPSFVQSLMSCMDSYNNRGKGSIEGIDYDFSSSKGIIRFGIGGHEHRDEVMRTDGGIPVILCDTDAVSSNTSLKGTVNEQCVTIIIADYNSNIIHGLRIGRGESFSVGL